MTAPPSKKLTTTEAARLLGVHVGTLRRWVHQGRIRAYTTPGGRSLRFDPDDIDNALVEVEPTEEAS